MFPKCLYLLKRIDNDDGRHGLGVSWDDVSAGFEFINSIVDLSLLPSPRLLLALVRSAFNLEVHYFDLFVSHPLFEERIGEVEEEKKVGFQLSLDTFKALKKAHPKIHMMSANNFELVSDLLKA